MHERLQVGLINLKTYKMIHLYHVQTCAIHQYLLLGVVAAKNLVLNVGHLGERDLPSSVGVEKDSDDQT